MIRYILIRCVGILGVLFAMSLITFALMHSIPGGPFDNGLVARGVPLPTAVRQNLLKAYGLDKPLYVQYGLYMWHALHLDFGFSFAGPSETVTELIGRTWKISAQLGLMTIGLASSVGLTLGILAATHKGSWLDSMTTVLSMVGTVVPGYFFGLFAVILFAVILRWLPPGGWAGPKYWIMPVAVYSLSPMAYIARFTRAAVTDELSRDYVRTARAKGCPEPAVIIRHAFRNALIPILTILGPLVGDLMTGSMFIETIFRVPGLGRYFVTSIYARDYPMIMGTTLLLAALMAVINLLTDLAYVGADPRIRLGQGT